MLFFIFLLIHLWLLLQALSFAKLASLCAFEPLLYGKKLEGTCQIQNPYRIVFQHFKCVPSFSMSSNMSRSLAPRLSHLGIHPFSSDLFELIKISNKSGNFGYFKTQHAFVVKAMEKNDEQCLWTRVIHILFRISELFWLMMCSILFHKLAKKRISARQK